METIYMVCLYQPLNTVYFYSFVIEEERWKSQRQEWIVRDKCYNLVKSHVKKNKTFNRNHIRYMRCNEPLNVDYVDVIEES